MKKQEIDFDFEKDEEICCPVTDQVIMDQDQVYLSDASLFYYFEPDF